jgi:1,4-alpha-glucan branching enzyme
MKKVVSAAKKKYEEIHFVDTQQPVWNYSLFTEDDIRNFQQGTHYRLYELLGNKQLTVLNTTGTYFAVWAPNATAVSVIGNFNNWTPDLHPLKVRLDSSGIWEGFIPNIGRGESYKYHIHGYKGIKLDKGDPFAHFWEKRPLTASITWDTFYEWKDEAWMTTRKKHNALTAPYSVYEVHLASWMRPDKNDEETYNSYQEIWVLRTWSFYLLWNIHLMVAGGIKVLVFLRQRAVLVHLRILHISLMHCIRRVLGLS